MAATKWLLLGIADAGAYLEGTNYTSCTTYDYNIQAFYNRLEDGGVVMDKRPCAPGALVSGIISGPMVEVELPHSTISRCGQRMSPDDEYYNNPRGYVSLDLYVQYWENRGARVGYRRGLFIHWNDGCIEPIDMSIQK